MSERTTTSGALQSIEPLHVPLAFTGTRFPMTSTQAHHVITSINRLCPAVPSFWTGACTGLDALVGQFCYLQWPDAEHHVIVPADQSQVDRWWLPYGSRIDVRYMEPGTTYKDRNQALVDASGRLIGVPIGPEKDLRQKRSGTWQTIRMARRDHSEQPIILPIWLW